MNEVEAKDRLAEMLDAFTVGSILHLLGEIIGQQAEDARIREDGQQFEQFRLVEHSLIVVGMGIDAAMPT